MESRLLDGTSLISTGSAFDAPPPLRGRKPKIILLATAHRQATGQSREKMHTDAANAVAKELTETRTARVEQPTEKTCGCHLHG